MILALGPASVMEGAQTTLPEIAVGARRLPSAPRKIKKDSRPALQRACLGLVSRFSLHQLREFVHALGGNADLRRDPLLT